MPPLNLFLAAFFKSSVPAQCTPVHHHILLVPTTDVLLTSRETESTAPLADYVASEEFLASHVLRIPNTNVGGSILLPEPPAGLKPAPVGKRTGGAATAAGLGFGDSDGDRDAQIPAPSLRDVRGKPRVYSTINGRSVMIKDATVFTHKGFKLFTNATLLHDMTWYPDTSEPRQWLIYFISKPLLGNWEEVIIQPALLVEDGADGKKPPPPPEQAKPANGEPTNGSAPPRKKDVQSFHDVFNHFPTIARHMRPGLERLFKEFMSVFEAPLPPPPSALVIPDPQPDGPIAAAAKRARSNSAMSQRSTGDTSALHIVDNFYSEDDEHVMRASLESAVTSAIDLFQSADKGQLSLLGATTDLTGPLVERLIERYVAENVHGILFKRMVASRRPHDLELESKIKQMEYIDVSQLGIALSGGTRGKHEVTIQLGQAIKEFRKMGSAVGPHQMMDLLLSTIRLVTHLTQSATPDGEAGPSEKSILTVNADTLVSLLLFVIIRAQVRNLSARLGYIRNFIFVDDVEVGEIGYALSTFEAVLLYLDMDSAGLRKASRRNKALWDAASQGNMSKLREMMEPSAVDELSSEEEDESSEPRRLDGPPRRWSRSGTSSKPASAQRLPVVEQYSLGNGLSHVFPFQTTTTTTTGPLEEPALPYPRPVKRVVMDTRTGSMSGGSEHSGRSRATSFGSIESALQGDVSIERLSQTCNTFGESVLMLAVQHGQIEALCYLLSLSRYYPIEFILDDVNNEDTTLLSAAVQLGNQRIIKALLGHIMRLADHSHQARYFAAVDIWGRSFGHYLFNAPWLISAVAHVVPWRQKDKNGQTPLFALCRSYDHANYVNMVMGGLSAAMAAQGDGRSLHLDDHVDAKGNTLLHVVNDPRLALVILRQCDVDVNAANDKRFTALMVASKYGRYDMVRALFSDDRVDKSARELRGLTAVDLAKDDEVRNRMDDLALFATDPDSDGRVTAVVRAFFVEDATVRLVLKSAAPSDSDCNRYVMTTSKRGLSDFEYLSNLLALENPASWIPAVSGLRTPFQIPSKPSRAVLRDIQTRADWFLKIMMTHPTFSTHEMLWEFVLVPDLRPAMMEQRSKLKAQIRAEKTREELEPVEDVKEVEQFVDHARDMVRGVNYATKSAARRAHSVAMTAIDLYDASALLNRAFLTLPFLPQAHLTAFGIYLQTLAPSAASPHLALHSSLMASQNTIQALMTALSKPAAQVVQIVAARRAAERTSNSLGRAAASRWPLGLLDDTRQRMVGEKEDKARRAREAVDTLGKELRHSQQVVAGELAGWQEMHVRMCRRSLRDFTKDMLVLERGRLQGVQRALRRIREGRSDLGWDFF